MLAMMSRSMSALLVSVTLLLQVTVASLPHVHADDAPRVASPHRDHTATDGASRCVKPPLAWASAGTCVACTAHAPQLAAPATASGPLCLAAAWIRVAADRLTEPGQQRWNVRMRGPPVRT